MTVFAKSIFVLDQQCGKIGTMVIMTGCAPLIHRSMNKLALEIDTVMTGKTQLIPLLLDQALVLTVMGLMATGAKPFLHRLVDIRFGLKRLDQFAVAGITELRLLGNQKGPTDQPMGAVTTTTLPLKYRSMHNASRIPVAKFIMAIQTPFAALHRRGRGSASN